MLYFFVGATAITIALLVFMGTLHIGLTRNNWTPLVIVVSLWFVAMIYYSASSMKERQAENAQRIEALSD